MARKGATQQQNSGRRRSDTGAAVGRARSGAARTDGLERALWVTLGLSALTALVQLYIHAQLAATRGAYTSFCNVNATVNCDAVLASAYGTLLGVPVAAWGLVSYVAFALLLFRRGRTVGAARTRTSLLLLGLAIWNAAFSLYMAAVSSFVIGHLCLLCLATYVLVAIAALLAWRLAAADLAVSGQPVLTPRRAAVAGLVIGVGLAAAAAAQLATRPISGATMTADDVRAADPEFYEWFTSRPPAKDVPAPVHQRGPADAAVTIVEFSDFECPACAMAFHDLHDLAARNPEHVRLVFHHFPLDSECNANVPTRMHRNACQAAVAAECAARHGKFWEYHDLLFGDQERLGRDDLIAKATGLGIPADAFAACLGDPAARARVLADAAAGAKLGVKSTPTLVINGRTIEGALDRNRYEYIIGLARKQ